MAAETPHAPDSSAFEDRMVGILNDSALALMISIGHRTGLFDTIAALAVPATSQQIATAAHLNERYVREWLGAMATGKIVTYDLTTHTYLLPPEHAAALTRAAGAGNLAIQAQYTALMGSVEDEVVQCFQFGGGVPYARYPRFQQLMSEDSGAMMDQALLSTILPLVPDLEDKLRAGIAVLDVGCGRGHTLNLLASAFPASQCTGYDFSEAGVADARMEATQKGLANAQFAVKNLDTLDVSEQFDLITAFDVIHDQAHPRMVLANILRALKPDGVFLMMDVAGSSEVGDNIDSSEHPLAPYMYTVSCMHCMTVSLALDGEGLGTMWGEQLAQQLLREAGFANVELKHVPGDLMNAYYIARKQ